MRAIAIGISTSIILALFIAAALLIHPFGEPPSAMDDYIFENSQWEIGTNETVTAVVFDYRGYDTLGEATILSAAVGGVIILFRKEMGK